MSDKKKRVRRKVGDVVIITLADGRCAYALVLPEPLMAFFDYSSPCGTQVGAEAIVKEPVAFRIWVMNHAVTSGRWPVVGHVSAAGGLSECPEFFKQDPLNGSLSITRGGGLERAATFEECQHLECAAVWEPEHVVSRLEDHFAGRRNKWVDLLRPKPPRQ
jgi:hypothetical protein